MEPVTIISAGMAILSPLIMKSGEAAFETIGEKLVEKTLSGAFWKKIKAIFIADGEQPLVEEIEKRGFASSGDALKIESKLAQFIASSAENANLIADTLHITKTNEFLIGQKLQSIERLKLDIADLELQMERAGIGTVGDYQIRISLQIRKLESQILELHKLLKQ